MSATWLELPDRAIVVNYTDERLLDTGDNWTAYVLDPTCGWATRSAHMVGCMGCENTEYCVVPTVPQVSKESRDNVNPAHYKITLKGVDYEARDVIRAVTNDYYKGSCLKYLLRAGKKVDSGSTAKETQLQDLKKARRFLDFLIEEMEEV